MRNDSMVISSVAPAHGHPTIYVTNWGLVRADDAREAKGQPRRASGPRGQHYTIMVRPRPEYGERGDGQIYVLLPKAEDVRAAREGDLSIAAYRQRYEAGVARLSRNGLLLRPGHDDEHMHAQLVVRGSLTWEPVLPGSTLACSCSAEAAAEGRCHRVWAAGLLLKAGWRVALDGRELAKVDGEGRPVWVSTEPAAGMLPGMEG
jgi:hypothetical protein